MSRLEVFDFDAKVLVSSLLRGKATKHEVNLIPHQDGTSWVDIRCYRLIDDEWKPTKKGVLLSPEEFLQVKEANIG